MIWSRVRAIMTNVNMGRLGATLFAVGLSLALASEPVLAQTVIATPLPNAKQTFVDANGKPLSGGSVYLYVPTTTTPKTTWSDTAEANPNTNPVVLDSAGRAQIFGQGNYDQQVKDANGNQQWYAFTTAVGSAQPAGATGTDTAPVGTVLSWAGFAIPTNWVLAYGQTLSRATYPDLLSALTITNASVSCVSTSTTLTGFADTSQMAVGEPIEASCLTTGVTIATIASPTSITVSIAANATTITSATVFPWGNGDGSLTFTLPDLRGRTFAGADAMGGTAASRLTSTYFGTSAAAPAEAGGSQSHTLTQAELSVALGSATSVVTDPGHVHNLSINGSGTFGNGSLGITGAASQTNSATTGITVATTITNASGGNAHAIVQPTLTINYIIKVKSNSTGAGGVVSLGGMFGDITCGANITCAGQTISATGTLSIALTDTHIYVGNGANVATDVALSGDCTITDLGAITCLKTNSVPFGTFATQNYATPPAIGGTTPNNVTALNLAATGNTTTNITGSTQCVQAGTGGLLAGSGYPCAGAPGTYILSHATGAWVCTAPDGSIVNTGSTTTSGIAECNAAAIANKGNLTAVCPSTDNSGYLAASTNITLGGTKGSYTFSGCNLTFTGGTNLTFDTMANGASFNWDGGNILCLDNVTTCIHIYPKTGVDGVYTFNPSRFSLPWVQATCASNGAMASIIDFDTTYGHTISQNTGIYAGKYSFGFVDGFDGSHNCAVAGVKVENPTDTYEAFAQNDIYVGYVQGVTTNYIQEGTGAVTQATQALGTNHWRFTIGTTGTPTNGFLTYGFLDRIEGTISTNSGTAPTNGINFAATTANGNWFNIPQLTGGTPIADSSNTTKNYGFANGGGYKTGGTW